MATRETLNKTKFNALKELAIEYNIDIVKKKKREIVSELLNAQVPAEVLTPVVSSVCLSEGIQPTFKENLPPFNKVRYSPEISCTIDISFYTIYNFMILRSTESGRKVKNFRCLDRAAKHYDAGDIQDISFAQIDETTVYIKGSCGASMKKTIYLVYLCVTCKEDTKYTVDYAYCQCPIGLAQSCSHIGGLLFAISNMKQPEQAKTSCTSKLCQWKIPRQSMRPQPASNLKIKTKSASKITSTISADFDPRHSDDRNFNIDWSLKQLTELKTIFPKTAMSHLWNIPDEVPEAHYEEEMETSIHPLEEKMSEMIYKDSNFPPVSIDDDLVKYIECNTRGQRGCGVWKALHHGRITSSLFGDVLAAGDSANSLIKLITEGSNLEKYNRLPEAIIWGNDHEASARKDYADIKAALCDNFSITSTGLTICSTHSFLGASGDGRVTDGTGTGVLEIKCPFSVGGTRVTHMQVPDIVNLGDKSFCLENSDGGPRLKRSHKYYAQVQGEMAMMGLPWCDFVVWTAAPCNNISIDRVYFDQDYVKEMLPKLVKFYMDHIFPCYYS